MIEITKSQEAQTPIEAVWKVISDIEGEQKFWPNMRNVKVLGIDGNKIEREATIRRGPMGEAKSLQTLVVDPAEKTTTLKMTKGPLLGTRKISLIATSKDTTKINVSWQFDMKGIPSFALGFVKDNISDVTERALAGIASEAERQTA